MLEKVKAAIKKMKPETKKKKIKKEFNNMDDLQKGVAVNRESKSETKTETKSSLTFGK